MGNCNTRCYSLQGFEKWNAHQRRWPNPDFHLMVILVEIYMICSRPAKDTPTLPKKFNCNLLHISWLTKTVLLLQDYLISETEMLLLPRPWPNIQLLLSHTSFIHQLVRCSNQNSRNSAWTQTQKKRKKNRENRDKGRKEEIRYSN